MLPAAKKMSNNAVMPQRRTVLTVLVVNQSNEHNWVLKNPTENVYLPNPSLPARGLKTWNKNKAIEN